MRILAVDYGRKRLGLAWTDPLGMIAQPGGCVPAGRRAAEEIARIVREKEIARIVLGHPLSLDGTSGPMAREVEAFAEKLRAETGVPVILKDERFTTAQAERALLEGDVSRNRRRELRDSIAACLLLQGFLRSDSREAP